MSVNFDLLDTVMTYIDTYPEQHDQARWADDCGTTCCFGGWTVQHLGREFVEGFTWGFDGSLVWALPDEQPDGVWTIGGVPVPYRCTPDVAAEALGLNKDQANRLFYACRTRDDLRSLISEWKASA